MAKNLTSCINYALLFAVLLIMLLVPVFSVALVFAALPLLIIAYLKRHVAFPIVTLAFFLLFGIIKSDSLLIISYSTLIAALMAIAIAFKLKGSIIEQMCLAAAIAIFITILSAAIVCLAAFKSPQQLYADYITDNGSDFTISFLAKNYYNSAEQAELSAPKLDKQHPDYHATAVTEYARFKRTDMDKYMLWYVSGYAFMLTCVGYLLSIALSRRRRMKTLTYGGESLYEPKINQDNTPICELRLKRSYLIIGLLPACFFSIFSAIEAMQPITVAVFNLLVTLPLSLCGFTLLLHCVEDRFYLKAKNGMRAVLIIIMAVMCIFYEYGMLILSLLGFADCVLNVRYLLDWALSK